MSIEEILKIIRDEALQADNRAAEACKRSKYSVQDYHMCIEFYLQNLHDRLAREAGLSIRCPIYPMRARIADLRREVARELSGGITMRAADGAKALEHTGTPYTCEHPDCKKWWGDRPAGKANR